MKKYAKKIYNFIVSGLLNILWSIIFSLLIITIMLSIVVFMIVGAPFVLVVIFLFLVVDMVYRNID